MRSKPWSPATPATSGRSQTTSDSVTRPSATLSTTSTQGHVPTAIDWYVQEGRVHAAPSKDLAMSDMVKAWTDNVADGRDALLVAYHRESVEALNRAAHEGWRKLGKLSGPELRHPVAGATGPATGSSHCHPGRAAHGSLPSARWSHLWIQERNLSSL